MILGSAMSDGKNESPKGNVFVVIECALLFISKHVIQWASNFLCVLKHFPNADKKTSKSEIEIA